MKLRNKKTGEIIIPSDYTFATYDDGIRYGRTTYYSLAELNEEWEDYEEPKEVWYIDFQGVVRSASREENDWFKENEIGNYFETKEEAEKAVEKLKAWKRLKDKGFKWRYYSSGYHRGTFTADFIFDEDKLPIMDTFVAKDLDLLFGGEE